MTLAMQDMMTPAARTQALQLLLVEDDADLLWVYALILSRCGYAVTTATSVATARCCWKSGTFDIVVCDFHLSDGDGAIVIRMAHAAPSPPLTLLMSVRDDVRQLARHCRAEGAYDKGRPLIELVNWLDRHARPVRQGDRVA